MGVAGQMPLANPEIVAEEDSVPLGSAAEPLEQVAEGDGAPAESPTPSSPDSPQAQAAEPAEQVPDEQPAAESPALANSTTSEAEEDVTADTSAGLADMS